MCMRSETRPFSFKRPNGCSDTLLLNRPLGISRCRLSQRVFVHLLPQIHLATCTKFPVQCTNKCGVRDIPREMVRCFFFQEFQITVQLLMAAHCLPTGTLPSFPWYKRFVRLILLFTGHFRVPKPHFESEADCSETFHVNLTSGSIFVSLCK